MWATLLGWIRFFCFSFFLYQFVGSLDITVEALERKQKRKRKHCMLYSNWCSIDFTCFYCTDCDGVRRGRGVDKKWFHVGRLIWPVSRILLLAQARLETLIYVLNDYFIRFGNIYALFMPCKLYTWMGNETNGYDFSTSTYCRRVCEKWAKMDVFVNEKIEISLSFQSLRYFKSR